MSSNSHSPRRGLPRYQNMRQLQIKKQAKKAFTHQDFMDFVEPFYENLKKKNFEDFKKNLEAKNFNLKKEVYQKWSSPLNEKLFSSYQFDDNVEIEDVEFEVPLQVIKPIKFIETIPVLYENKNILESYRIAPFNTLLKEYQEQIERNNKRRLLILEQIPKRIKVSSYFCAYDLINSKLEEVQKKKLGLKKKTKLVDIESDLVKEYLDRIYEFFEVFGTPDQFNEYEMVYPDIINDGLESEMVPECRYFE